MIGRESYSLSSDWTFTNHGSFGACPKIVQAEQLKLKAKMESIPDEWFRHESQVYWMQSLAVVAKFLDSNLDDIGFVHNPTAAINSVMRTIEFVEGDEILITNMSYLMVKNCIEAIKNIKIHYLPLDVTNKNKSDVIDQYQEILDSNPRIRLTVIDAITSPTALRLPFEELLSMCHAKNIITVLDAAHAPGQIKLSLSSLEADFVTGAFHKWLFAPRGSSFLWVHPKFHDQLKPPVVAHEAINVSEVLKSPMHMKLFYQGTMDYTASLVLPTCIQFFDQLGGFDKLWEYCSTLVDKAAKYLAQLWQTKQAMIPDDMKAPYMRLILLPDIPLLKKMKGPEFETYLRENYKLVSAVSYRTEEGHWLRISCHAYNTWADYEFLGNAIQKLRNIP